MDHIGGQEFQCFYLDVDRDIGHCTIPVMLIAMPIWNESKFEYSIRIESKFKYSIQTESKFNTQI